MDESQRISYMLLMVPPNDVEKSAPTLCRVPKCLMLQVPTPISQQWRDQVRPCRTPPQN